MICMWHYILKVPKVARRSTHQLKLLEQSTGAKWSKLQSADKESTRCGKISLRKLLGSLNRMRLQPRIASLSVISPHDDEIIDLERKKMEDLGTIVTKESSKMIINSAKKWNTNTEILDLPLHLSMQLHARHDPRPTYDPPPAYRIRSFLLIVWTINHVISVNWEGHLQEY